MEASCASKMLRQSTLAPSSKLINSKTGEPSLPEGGSKRKRNYTSVDNSVRSEFVQHEEGSGVIATCKHCRKGMGQNVTRWKEHLLNPRACSFLNSEAAKTSEIREVKEAVGGLNTPCVSQRVIITDSTSVTEKEALDKALAKLIISANLPFSIVERPDFIELIKLLRPSYTLPSRKELAETLLLGCSDDSVDTIHRRRNPFTRQQKNGWTNQQDWDDSIVWLQKSLPQDNEVRQALVRSADGETASTEGEADSTSDESEDSSWDSEQEGTQPTSSQSMVDAEELQS